MEEKSSLPPALPSMSTSTAMVTENFKVNGNPNGSTELQNAETEVDNFNNQIDDLFTKADELERRVKEVSEFYVNKKKLNVSKGGFRGRKEVSCTSLMKGVMDEFGKKLKLLTQHQWAEPFLEPVDVVGLGLDDYYQIIKKPMDFATIRKQMETNVYKNAREIYADVRLIFTNAMTYNDDKNDVHIMAKTMMDKFEEKWLEMLPKVMDAEARQKEEVAQAMAKMQIAQEDAIVKLARDTNNELNKLNLHVEELREMAVQRSRRITTRDKRNLSIGLSKLSHDNLSKALDIVYGKNYSKNHLDEPVEIDIDAQSALTVWRLKFFLKEALETQIKIPEMKDDGTLKRNRVIYEALTKTARKRMD